MALVVLTAITVTTIPIISNAAAMIIMIFFFDENPRGTTYSALGV
ncbi:MAG: hypothetical protein ACI4JT_00125 [Oscillospiraceae bacterium]